MAIADAESGRYAIGSDWGGGIGRPAARVLIGGSDIVSFVALVGCFVVVEWLPVADGSDNEDDDEDDACLYGKGTPSPGVLGGGESDSQEEVEEKAGEMSSRPRPRCGLGPPR